MEEMTIRYYAPALHMATAVQVVLPDEDDSQPWPVCFLLGPEGSSHGWWSRHARLSRMATEHHVVIVAPDVWEGCGFDMANGYAFGQALWQDLPNYLRRHVLCLDWRRVWMAGYGLSGLGVLQGALEHPNLLEAAGCLATGVCGAAPDAHPYLTEKRRFCLWGKEGQPRLDWRRQQESRTRFLFLTTPGEPIGGDMQGHFAACPPANLTETPEFCLKLFLAFAEQKEALACP